MHTLQLPPSLVCYSNMSALSSGIRRNLCLLINAHIECCKWTLPSTQQKLIIHVQAIKYPLWCHPLKPETDLFRKGEGDISHVTVTGRNLDSKLLIDRRSKPNSINTAKQPEAVFSPVQCVNNKEGSYSFRISIHQCIAVLFPLIQYQFSNILNRFMHLASGGRFFTFVHYIQ